MDGAGEAGEARGRERACGRQSAARRVKVMSRGSVRSKASGAGWQERFQVVDRGYEVALLHGHREIDGVEVDFATEAATEIRRRVDRRVALVATGTQEYQLSVAEFVRPLQSLQERGPGNVIA